MNDLMILAKFDFNGKTYLITLKNDKIFFYVRRNKAFSKELFSDELKMCLEVLESITIKKETSVYLRNNRLGNNVYKIFFDTNTRLYWWEPINLKGITIEDNRTLAFLYNNTPDVYYSNNEKGKEKSKEFITLRKCIRGTIIALILTAEIFVIDRHTNYRMPKG